MCGGALTTGGAAIPLCFSLHFLLIEMAGAFILSVACFGLFFSFAMLVPLLMILGPTDKQGDLDAILNPFPTGLPRGDRAAEPGRAPRSPPTAALEWTL